MTDGTGDFVKWLQATHGAVSSLDANLEAVVVCLKNISTDLNNLIGLMDSRPAGLGKQAMESPDPGDLATG